jgi:glutathione S-transferase
MTLVLYDSAVSGNCYKVRLLLTQLGIPFERVELDVVDRSNRADVLGGLNPALRVPTLVFEDGRSLGESNAIMWYLADGTPFVPAAAFERAQVLQWQFFEQYDHEPNVAVARFWLTKRPGEVDADRLAGWHAGGYRALDALERHLDGRAFLVADGYSIADIALYAYTHVAGEGGFDLDRYPAIRGWLDRVAAEPGHVTIDQ